jgi:hypothetical protein
MRSPSRIAAVGAGISIWWFLAQLARDSAPKLTWILLAFIFPVGAGWVHLLMAGGVMLLIRRVVAGPKAW